MPLPMSGPTSGTRGRSVLAEYTDTPVRDFAGVPIQDLHKIEAKFEVNVCVYKLVKTLEEKTTAELVERANPVRFAA